LDEVLWPLTADGPFDLPELPYAATELEADKGEGTIFQINTQTSRPTSVFPSNYRRLLLSTRAGRFGVAPT
jgi:hypothetical protein